MLDKIKMSVSLLLAQGYVVVADYVLTHLKVLQNIIWGLTSVTLFLLGIS